MKISLIIPVLNEETAIRDQSTQLQNFREAGHEVIIVDGGSQDASRLLAEKVADQVLLSEKGRARQMNAGASVVTGDVLLFLHVDTDLPEGGIEALSRIAGHHKIMWGFFNVRLSGERYIFRVIETMMNWRSRLSGIATGDQAIFVSKTLFEQVGGYADIKLMEDIDISARLKKLVKPVCLLDKVTTSSRRWEISGVFTTILLMWRLRFSYWLGADPDRLVQRYYR